jgi:hypothetical protein
MISLGIIAILGVLLALLIGLSMQAGTYFLFRRLTDGLGKVPSMFLSAFLALATWEAVNYVSTANPVQQETPQERAALDQRLAGQGLCVAMLMPIWMLYDFFRKPKMRADATEKSERNSHPEGDQRSKQLRDEAVIGSSSAPSDVPPVAGLTVLLVIVVAAAVALALVFQETPLSPTPSQSVPSAVIPPAVEPTPTRSQEAEVVAPVPTENAIRPSPTEPVQIQSEPAGADVLMPGGILLGVTPLEVPRPSDGYVTPLTLRLPGYREALVGITEFSPRTVSRALVRLGSRQSEPNIAPRSDGQLEASQIREVIRAARPQLNECWETELRLLAVGPAMELQRVTGRPLQIDVDLVIDGSGAVVDVMTRGESVGALSACIRATVERWHFPAAGGQTRTSFPLVFSAS